MDLVTAKAKCEKSHTHNWTGHKAKVTAVAWNKTGTKLASGSQDRSARVWDARSLDRPAFQTLGGHTASVERVCWDTTNEDQMATAGADKTLRIWDLRVGNAPVCKITCNTLGANINIAWSPDGLFIAASDKEDVITIIDIRKMKLIKIQRCPKQVNEFAWDGKQRLFVTTEDGTVQIHTVPDMRHIRTINSSAVASYCIDFAKNGSYFAVGSADATVVLFTVPELMCFRTFTRLEWGVRSLAINGDSSLIAMGSEERIIDIAHVESGETVATLQTQSSTNDIKWHPSECVLAYVGDDQDRAERNESLIHVVRFYPS